MRVDPLCISTLPDPDREELLRILCRPQLVADLYPLSPRIGAADAVADWLGPPRGHRAFVVGVRSEDGTLRGSMRLDGGALSYFVDPDHWGQGYGKAMMGWAVDEVFGGYGSGCVTAITGRENAASIRLLEIAGFRFAGICGDLHTRTTLLQYVLRT
jgi:RimJ/RimL family protein N-acetyltransferase